MHQLLPTNYFFWACINKTVEQVGNSTSICQLSYPKFQNEHMGLKWQLCNQSRSVNHPLLEVNDSERIVWAANTEDDLSFATTLPITMYLV